MDISAYQHMNIRMSTRGKRPLRNLTPNDKVRAIQRIHNGETKASVSRDLGVPESTLRGWCKNEQKLRFMCRQLGPDHLGIDTHTPPEKRAKFDLQLLPPKLATLPNYDDLGLSNFLFSATEFPTQKESLFEKLSLVEFVKKNGLHPSAIRELGETHSLNAAANAVSGVDYSTNNMINQLTLLAQLNSKLSYQMGESADTDIKSSQSTDITDTAREENSTKISCPLLTVKNWAKDPAKRAPFNQATQLHNDKNNNAVDPSYSNLTTMKYPLIMEPVKSIYPETTVSAIPPPPFSTYSDLASAASTPTTDNDCQGAALLDWCKLFNASLNFLAFAAAAASMQPAGGTIPKSTTTQLPTTEADETYPFNSNLVKRLSPLAHSDASNESYFDSEPEDLSVRSCASVSSRNNSRSQTPDKSTATSIACLSDGEQ
ncbi:GL21906 [Drosophila persimilis]|uniref:GL21906 n=1 Tax=Drosophila persimilis TaxID=7234 RepID=B4GE17_DROPE|nr:protein distal antenna-related [Drosophila persimilis]EDW33852.1 GL21906 [Drosophila persimilis]